MATVTRRPFAPQFATVQTQHADIEARFPEFRKAATVPGKGVFEGFFPLIVSLSHPDWDRVETDTLYVKVNEWNFNSNAGPAVHMLEIPLYCGYIDFGSQQGIIPQFADIIGSTPGG